MKSVHAKSLLGMTVVALLALGCQSPLSQSYRGADAELRENRCAMYRIETELTKKKGVPRLYGYELLDGPIWVPRTISYQLSKLFIDPKHYRFEPVPDLGLCGFEPCCVARFGKLDLLYSLSCDKLQVRHGGKIVNMLDVTPMHDTALPIVKKVFPDDTYVKLLQPLPKRRWHKKKDKKHHDTE
jgi:hypothetical protein